MPRFATLTAAKEQQELERRFGGPQFTAVQTVIEPIVRNDTGRECPLLGRPDIRSLGRQDDLRFLISHRNGKRVNGWDQLQPSVRDAFDEACAAAVAGSNRYIRHVEVLWQVPESHVEDLLDDTSEVIYWSGGWRSGKTYRADQWWARGWCKYGGPGVRFWLVGPRLKHSFALMTKIFRGRQGVPPILPTDENGLPIFARRLPRKKSDSDLTITMDDGSLVELLAAEGEIANLEGEAVKRARLEEASRIPDSEAYDTVRSRLMQDAGQMGISSVPDDRGEWLYEKVVREAERGKPDRKLISLSGLDNPWLAEANYWRMWNGEPDPVVRAQKIEGKWDRGGMYAYSDVLNDAAVIDEMLDFEELAERLGKPDITTEVVRATFKVPRKVRIPPFLVMADFNWDPQTQLIAKFFGDVQDWRSWVMVFVREFVGRFRDSGQAAAELAEAEGGIFKGAVAVCDANGFHNTHMYPGKKLATFDTREFEKAGFRPRGPIATIVPGEKPHYSNPGVQDSRRINRYLFGQQQLVVLEPTCPRLLSALNKAPNRRKQHREAGSKIDREVYNLEDCARYGTWRIFEKHIQKVRKDAHDRGGELEDYEDDAA